MVGRVADVGDTGVVRTGWEIGVGLGVGVSVCVGPGVSVAVGRTTLEEPGACL